MIALHGNIKDEHKINPMRFGKTKKLARFATHYLLILFNRIFKERLWPRNKEPRWPNDYGY